MGAWITKRKDRPGWRVIAYSQGRQLTKSFRDKKQAKEFAEKMDAKIKWAEASGEPLALSQPDQKMPTVKAYLEDWLETYAKIHCKPSTYRGYARAIGKHLIPAFGQCLLHQLKREEVKRLIARLSKEGMSKGTIQNCLVPLKAAYNVAIEDGLVTFNPASRLGRLLKGSGDKRQHLQPLTTGEVVTLLKTAKDDYPHLFPVLLCAARTGLRMGELIGLQWGDIDFNGGFLEVRRAVVMRKETTTKSHKIRRVDMSRQLQEELRRLKEIRQLEAMNSGTEMALWVFLSPEGQRWDDRNLRRTWYRCLEKAEIRTVRFHDLRHSFVSLLINQGAHPKYIQEQAGHSSIQVTMDTYGHLFPSQNREWVNKLDEAGIVPASYPPLLAGVMAVEQQTDKPIDSTGELIGGGDPD